MKLLVILALLCALFSEVYPLECYECVPNGTTPCRETTITTCPSSLTKCASMTNIFTTISQSGQQQAEVKVKACATPTHCINAAVNFGISATTLNTQCCESRLCNSQFPPSPVSNPNGKKCFTCVDDDCTQTLACKGTEDRCIEVTDSMQSPKQKGCASQSVCSGNLFSQAENFTVNVNCCEGDMCNSALRIGQSILFLLLVPLASFILLN